MNNKLLTLLFVYSIFGAAFAEFELPTELYQGTDPKEIVVSDLNSDGKNDIVFIDQGKIQVLYQKNSFSFTSSQFSAKLDGIDENFEIASPNNMNSTNLTASAWFNFGDSIPNKPALVLMSCSGSTGFELKLNTQSNHILAQIYSTDGSFKVFYNSPGTGFNWTPETNTWYHIAFTHNTITGKAAIYLNAQKIFTWDGITTMQTGGSFSIGHKPGTTNTHFEGIIDEVSLFNKGLDDAEVMEIYNFGKPGNLSNHTESNSLVSWWTMGDHSEDNFNSFFGPKLLKDVVGTNHLTPVNTETEDKFSSAP